MDRVAGKLQSKSKTDMVVALLAFVTVGFHIYLIFTGLISNLVSRPIHLALVLPWIFLFSNNKAIVFV